MNLKDKLLNRIDELLEKPIPQVSVSDAGETFLALTNMFEMIYGTHSPQLELVENMRKQSYDDTKQEWYNARVLVQHLHGYLRELKAAIRDDRIVNIQFEAQGEVLGDFLGLARKALDEGEKDVAAVLACAALEDALKRCAIDRGLDVQDKNMSSVVNALKAEGVIPSLQGKVLDRYVQIRNKTFHAQWDEIDAASINAIIAFTEIFIIQQFSSPIAVDSPAAPPAEAQE